MDEKICVDEKIHPSMLTNTSLTMMHNDDS
jgi:hypothetical protein